MSQLAVQMHSVFHTKCIRGYVGNSDILRSGLRSDRKVTKTLVPGIGMSYQVSSKPPQRHPNGGIFQDLQGPYKPAGTHCFSPAQATLLRALTSESMDPITAVGFAATVVQLVDYSTKLVSKSREFYLSGSGVLVENSHIEKATDDLLKLNAHLKKSITNDPDLQGICDVCTDAAGELLVALSKVKVDGKGKIWQSFRKALRSIWSKDKLQELENRLARFRDEWNLRITVYLR